MNRKRSDIWLHFTKSDDTHATCDICKNLLSYKGGSTSNFIKHLNAKHPGVIFQQAAKKSGAIQSSNPQPISLSTSDSATLHLNTTSTSESISSSTIVVSAPQVQRTSRQVGMNNYVTRPPTIARQKKLNDLVIKMIVKDMQPFSIVEDSGFRELLAGFDPAYVLPHRTTLSRQLLPSLYDTSIATIKDILQSAEFITITTDLWTSCTTESYMAITSHFIDSNWIQQSVLLGCSLFSERHTADNLKSKIDSMLHNWNVQNRVHTVVTDNGANIVAACRLTKLNHLACFAHTLNLIVQDAIKLIKPIHVKAKTIVEFFNRSTNAAAKLKHFQEQLNNSSLKLKNDVITRWNSTYHMFQRMVQIKECINAALGVLDRPVEQLNSEEWIILNELCRLLEPFELITVELSGDQYVTVSKIIALIDGLTRALLKIKENTHSTCGKDLAGALLGGIIKKFDKIDFNLIITKPTFLDPRFKKRAFSNPAAYNKAKESIIANVTDMLKSQERHDSQAHPVEPSLGSIDKKSLIWDDFDNRNQKIATPQSSAIIEIRQYCEEPDVGRQENPLKWWESRQLVYPQLAKLAKKHLSIVATSVPSERIFSKSGQILTERRSRIKSDNFEKIIFLNANQHLVL